MPKLCDFVLSFVFCIRLKVKYTKIKQIHFTGVWSVWAFLYSAALVSKTIWNLLQNTHTKHLKNINYSMPHIKHFTTDNLATANPWELSVL